MMPDEKYRRIDTSAEVWAVIRARHGKELCVFSSYSAPDGNYAGVCEMFTEHGFIDSDIPFIGARTTWDRHPEHEHKRVNENHEYWLCVPKSEEGQ